MDHHHQWRQMRPPPPPPALANVCPVCGVSHAPFCDPNPYLPSYHHHHPPPHTDWGFGLDYNNAYVGEPDRRSKRPRVDDFSSPLFRHDCNPNLGMVSMDDERRLKLIRDHGSANLPYNLDSGALDNPYQNLPYQVPEFGNAEVNFPQNHPFNRPPQPYGMPSYQSPVNETRGYLTRPPPPPPPPPLPASPPPPIPVEPPVHAFSGFNSYSSPPKTLLFPVPITSSLTNPYLQNHSSTAFYSEEWQKSLSPDKPTVIDASTLFKQPHRSARPEHIVIILRGLPGSGKSYLAKMMRDLEIENGGNAPRIHSMDDYFMTEIEKVEEISSKSLSFGRGKKPAVKKVMEYCYEPEMEEAYRNSMLKAFRKTLEEGGFSLVIVDDRNLRVADFAQFWAIAKRSGYEVYISEAAYKDPAGCAARNVHGFTLDEIRNMAQQWEEAPKLYMKLDIKSLFHGDDLKESGIQEVDMDMEDEAADDNTSRMQERKTKIVAPPLEDDPPQVSLKDEKRWDVEEDHRTGAKELTKSKWSNDLDENDKEPRGLQGNLNALSGLVQTYGKHGKSVRWSDQVGNTGFSIHAAKKATMLSLVIGPGSGYNLKTNPLPDETSISTQSNGVSSRQGVFQERLRAEHESFKAVFDKRRRRIGRLNLDEE
ncbi:P-loop containing nucleoside triphosphate hydrolases superfamily protein [Euphorbia peplus]|nr:P-loop containing nucleoside triphosphate hydrolases superfamily protein [Euphorbia peplus]